MKQANTVKVCDVMKKQVDMIDGKLTVAEALAQMHHTETKTLLVDKRFDGDEYGMVMLSDIAKQVLAKDRSPERVNIYEIMTKPVISVDLNMDIRYCARLFERVGLSRAPVVEAGKMIGIVSYTDMVLKGVAHRSD
ncbi:MAG: CBS domain-containing protein [Gammaproteobacteria bacterium]|nr:CBS domain-containing protein [Gammaproteobacteria bacterium]